MWYHENGPTYSKCLTKSHFQSSCGKKIREPVTMQRHKICGFDPDQEDLLGGMGNFQDGLRILWIEEPKNIGPRVKESATTRHQHTHSHYWL